MSEVKGRIRIKEDVIWSLLFLYSENFKKHANMGVFLQDFIVLTVCIISVHFRYIYSTNLIGGQDIVRLVNLPEKYSYS